MERDPALERYNASEECNKLRFHYLVKVKRAYETYDFSELFDDLDEKCIMGGKIGKQAVIENFKQSAISMKERNYWHRCTIVQVRGPVTPVECNTKPDGTGVRVLLDMGYSGGEFCMVDRSPLQTLFFRMKLSLEGKILQYYATIPPYNFIPISSRRQKILEFLE